MTNATICCISDCHLGYMHRLKRQRLEDYEASFREAMEKALAEKPGLIIFGGDLFHHSRPDAASMKLLITTLMDAAAYTQIVLCVGNHEIDGNIKKIGRASCRERV
jgi:DNA repair exonuclease SbcCD nuclease subunit